MTHSILSVDDSPSIRKLVEFTLKSKGYQVQSSPDGIEALELLARNTFSLIYLDINMPRMDGFELLKKIRSNSSTASIPIVMLTTEGQDEDRGKAIGMGVNDYIVKPFKPTELLEMTEKILG
jgi:two-component system chemotaxis response regulator CheY